MIRINLLPSKRKRTTKSSGQQILAIAGAALLAVLGLMFLWGQSLDEDLINVRASVKAKEAEVGKLEDTKGQLEGLEKKKEDLARQNLFFEQKRFEKSGPPEMFKFFSYTLTKKEDNLYNRDEIKAQEAAGWAPSWNTDNVWITSITEVGTTPPLKGFTIKGMARSHEDVAEFYRRLESGVYFIAIDPVVQQVTKDKDWEDVELVSFEAFTYVSYGPDGEIRVSRDDIPRELLPLIREVPAASTKDAAKKGAKKPTGKEG